MRYNKEEKQHIMEMETVAYWSGLGGVEIKNIEYGIEDYVVCVANAAFGKPSVHRVKINYDSVTGSPFFTVCNNRVRLDECIRTGF